MSSIPAGEDVLDPDEPVYTLPEVADLLGIPITKVHQQLREHHLVAVRRNKIPVIPTAFFSPGGQVVKHLNGLLAVLYDGGYSDTEILRWLFTPDESLTVTVDGFSEKVANSRPVDALRSHQAREVMRRAQASAF
ncbi:DNA-binding protein [Mycolicibacterium insubricum]|uniref:DNA-binding protein n=1 Tax=Mycolicibacterium insubricum TaxID=444597 RepID=A0A1X0DJ26_9MYCO|nr:Rv2175c family DNA-binding protein [Mycolicibacterium insubricum]MCB9441329.1 DNA-binding protein [Mycolicibacterium sp.]MCV7081730.1 DNA-binding protein [Mycolicibacterium insubricum]ORA72388.1 DNA-binding protein [Mycolicibacterium insubricum]BBZ67693.1 DNA-binding protein [Mycolicibacterium insubricum]